jgi:hypothetical protein
LLVVPALRLRRMCTEQAETSENLAARDSHERTYFRPDFGRKLNLHRFVQVTPPSSCGSLPSRTRIAMPPPTTTAGSMRLPRRPDPAPKNGTEDWFCPVSPAF